MSEWILLTVSIVAVALVAGGLRLVSWWNRRRFKDAGSGYADVAARLGLEDVSHRWIFDTRVSRLRGEMQEYGVEVELWEAGHRPFTRISVTHPGTLNLGVRILHDDREGLWTRLLRMREAELGEGDFDRDFLLMTREEERLRKLLTSRIRRLFLELAEGMRDVRGGDEGVFIAVDRVLDPEEADQKVRAAVRLARALDARSEEIREGEARDAAEKEPQSIFTPMPGDVEAVEFSER